MEEIKQQLQNIYSCMSYITHSRVELVKTRNYLCANPAACYEAVDAVRLAIDKLMTAEVNLLNDADILTLKLTGEKLHESKK